MFIRNSDQVPKEIPRNKEGLPKILISGVRPTRRINSRGQQLTDLVVEAIQRYVVKDPQTGTETTYRGGCTLLIDMQQQQIRYAIRKRVASASRMVEEQSFRMNSIDGTQGYFEPAQEREPFAFLHRGV